MSIALTSTNRESRSTELLHTTIRLSTLALAAIVISANFTNYGPLIPLLQRELHINSGATGLLSTLLYVGIGLSYLPGGWLADRYGSRRVLLGALLLVDAGGCLLPVIPNLIWIMLCRFVIGLGAGAAIVAGSQAARRGKYAAFGQGLFGGAMQVGAGLGLFATPTLLDLFGWRGTFTAWGLMGLGASALCLLALSGETPGHAGPVPRRITKAFRSSSLWTIGLVHLGTLGLGQAIAPWLAVYFALSYGLPLGLAAMLGATGLLAGMIFRPLGGMLLSRKVFTHSMLMRTGSILACAGVVMLALPLHAALVSGCGLALFACGTTLPYAAVFDEAGHIGTESALGPGTAQGVVSVISAPASAFGPPLIGTLLGHSGNFALPFGAMVLVGMVALIASLFVGPIVVRNRVPAVLSRLARNGDAFLAQTLASRSHALLPASTVPSIAVPSAFPLPLVAKVTERMQPMVESRQTYRFRLETKEGATPRIAYEYPIYVRAHPDWAEFRQRLVALHADHFTLVVDAGLPLELVQSVYKNVCELGVPCLLIPLHATEKAKLMQAALSILYQARAHGGGTHASCFIALGGGLVGNITGLAASLLVRGIKLVHIPTTLLAATDSILSCKQGVNGEPANGLLIKNLVGTFKAPEFVLVYLSFWQSLQRDEIRSGLCELAKNVVAIHPHRYAEVMSLLNPEAKYSLEQCARLFTWCFEAKQAVMCQDAHEQGPALVLEAGHTVGHALESLLGIRHGLAIALGLLVEAHISHARGWLGDMEVRQHYSLLQRNAVPTTLPRTLDIDTLIRLIRDDNKIGYLPHREGYHVMVLLRHLGQPVEERPGLPLTYVSETELRTALAALMA